MADPLFGVDVSNYQAGISMAGIKSEGFEFAFCKISQGSGYRSPDWPRQRDQAHGVGLVLAGYHYIDTSDPNAQAANCASWIGDTNIPIALDCEKNSGDIGQYHRVLDACRAYGLHVALSYIPRWYWQQIGSPDLSGLPPLWSSRYPTTVAGYASALYGGVPTSYWSGYGGLNVGVLQFSKSTLVQGQLIDADAFLGTRNDLIHLLGSSTSTPAPPPAPTPQGGPMATDSSRIAATWNQLAGTVETPAGPLPGWPTWDGGTGESLTLVDYLRRNNVEVRALHGNLNDGVHPKLDAISQKLDALNAKLDALSGTPHAGGPLAITAADIAAIAKAVNDDAAHRLAS